MFLQKHHLALSRLMHSIHWVALYFCTKRLEEDQHKTLTGCAGLYVMKNSKTLKVSTKMAVFWDVAPCSLVEDY
jgi:hypothetical protein